jgi:hypothetical protein
VSLDATSNWTMTADITVQNFTNSLSSLENIHSHGHTLYYNSTVSTWLDGKTVRLSGGGFARPISTTSSRVKSSTVDRGS